MPRTINDLEQFFGRYRYHEDRCSSRKGASPGLVVHGQVRLLAAAVTRLRAYSVAELAQVDLLIDVKSWALKRRSRKDADTIWYPLV